MISTSGSGFNSLPQAYLLRVLKQTDRLELDQELLQCFYSLKARMHSTKKSPMILE
jgi:hypothetical protein